MLFREIIGCGEPVPAAADDDDVIARPGLGVAPDWPPAAIPAERLMGEREN
jgi:hypothetical protein